MRTSKLSLPEDFKASDVNTWKLLPKSWSEARDQGVRFYFNGATCNNGHIAPWFVSIRKCAKCANPAFGRGMWKGKCEHCNKTFESRKSGTKYCSQKCRYKHNNALSKAQRELNREDKKCIVCDKIFTPKTKQTAVCSDACWEIRNKQTSDDAKKRYLDANTADVYQRNRNWAKRNQGKMRTYANNRRALKENAILSNEIITHEKIRERFMLTNGCCYCGAQEQTIEHVIPLNRGGYHTISNILGACGRCNSSKGDKLLEKWYPKQSFYSEDNMKTIFKLIW